MTTYQLLVQSRDVHPFIMHTRSPFFKAWKVQYLQAFRLYTGGRWKEAREEIIECMQMVPKDGPSMVMREFVEGKIEEGEVGTSGGGEKWGGYRVLEEK